ncbi:AAA family ATPase [Methanocalculus sp.]|uniref:AAA family ATPase n=1 Tax=Methanocalculus sp. TaxID=2004547 RepID=UPI00260C0E98|nr:AAA family ATPase [Methanocalculus sp.]MDG6249753.1 AAA family ATPase [Methanocalculus sp.]
MSTETSLTSSSVVKSSSRLFSKNLAFSDKPLIKDLDILECDHIPDQVLFRDPELEEMAFLIRPGLRGQRPANIFCRGLPGTGKTTCIHHLFAQIRDASQTLIPVYVNCQQNRTAFAVFSTIYRELVGHAPPSSGVPLRKLVDAVAKALQSGRESGGKSGRESGRESGKRSERQAPAQSQRQNQKGSGRPVLLVCLDDIHHLIHEGTDTQILSSLLRIHLDYPGCRVSVILVESDLALDISRRLDPSVISSLCSEEVFFPPYTANQIRGILRERARQAAYPGAISPEILDLITHRTKSTEPGDLRVGIDLLKRSILRAERAAHTTVTEEDVAAAYGDARLTHLRGLVSVLTEKERTLLSVIAGMVEESEMAARKRYEEDSEYRERGEYDGSSGYSGYGGYGRSEEDGGYQGYGEDGGYRGYGEYREYLEPLPPTSGRIFSRLQEVLAAGHYERLRQQREHREQGDQREHREQYQKLQPQRAAEPQSGELAACAEPEPGYRTGSCPHGADARMQDEQQRTEHHLTETQTPEHEYPELHHPETEPPTHAISYTTFYELLRSLATYALIRITIRQAKGRTSEVTLRYRASDVRKMLERR